MLKVLAIPGMTEIIVQLVVLVVSAVITPALVRFIKLKGDDKTRTYFDKAVEGAIRAAINAIAKSQGRTPMALLLAVVNDHSVRDSVVLFARNYLQWNTPDALKRLGIGANMADIIVSRIDAVVEAMAENIGRTAQSLESATRSPIPVEKPAANLGVLGSDNPAPTVAPDENQPEAA